MRGNFNGDKVLERFKNKLSLLQINKGGGSWLDSNSGLPDLTWGVNDSDGETGLNAFDVAVVFDANKDGIDEILLPTALELRSASCDAPTESCYVDSGEYDDYRDLFKWRLYTPQLQSDSTIRFVALPDTGIVAPLKGFWSPTDYDGDGYADLIFRLWGQSAPQMGWGGPTPTQGNAPPSGWSEGLYRYSFAGDDRDVIAKIDVGLGVAHEFMYAMAAKSFPSNLTCPEDSQVPPVPVVPSTSYCRKTVYSFPLIGWGHNGRFVTQYKRSDGVGGQNTVKLYYRDWAVDAEGRGAAGYQAITEITSNTLSSSKSLQTLTEYNQVFPTAGLVTKTKINNVGSTSWLSNVSSAPRSRSSNAGRPCPYSDDTLAIQYDPTSGAEISRTRTDVELDTFCNTDKTVTTVSDSYITAHTTVNDPLFEGTIDWPNKPKSTTILKCFSSSECVGNGTNQTQSEIISWFDVARRLPGTVRSGHISDPAQQITTSYSYDLYGNVLTTSVSGGSGDTTLSTRSSTTAYQTDGYFPDYHLNALNQKTDVLHDASTGLVTETTDALMNKVITTFDAFGRVQTQRVDGVSRDHTTVTTTYGTDNLVNKAVYKITQTQPGVKPTTVSYYDALNRVIRTEVGDLLGRNQVVAQTTEYDAFGRVTKQSIPYFSSSGANDIAPTFTYFNNYDVLDRPGNKVLPNGYINGLTITYTYTGARTDIQVGSNSAYNVYRIKNALGQWWEVQDQGSESAYGHSEKVTTSYRYDVFGNPTTITRNNGTKAISNSAIYNVLGHKTQMTDPERGTWNFVYNVAGELVKQTDAKGQRTFFDVDVLGRVLRRYESLSDSKGTAVASWTYATSCIINRDTNATADALCASSGNGSSKAFEYDKQGALTQTTYQLGVKSFVVQQSVDTEDPPLTLTYPNNRLTQTNEYNAQGFLEKVKSGALVLNDIDDIDAFGHITLEKAGNNLYTKRQYDNQTGALTGQCVSSNSACAFNAVNNVQSLDYGALDGYTTHYDVYGNLQKQINHVQGVSESFTYDLRQRLVQSHRVAKVGGGFADVPLTINYRFDAFGNLIQKDDVAPTLQYGSVAGSFTRNAQSVPYGPHQLGLVKDSSGSTLQQLVYDENGNVTSSTGLSQYTRNISYNHQMVPTSITRGSNSASFTYDENNARYYQEEVSNGKTTKTWKIGQLFDYVEITENNQTKTEERHYIVNGEYQYFTATNCGNWRYFHSDRLGSIETITSASGTVLERQGYDPYGKVRAANQMVDRIDASGNKGLFSQITSRGFTNAYDHLDGVGLQHANGRLYDFELGRFTGVDPFISDPKNAQSYNPYSYVGNNPIMGTDPTGYLQQQEGQEQNLIWGDGGGIAGLGFSARENPFASLSTTGTITITITIGNGANKDSAGPAPTMKPLEASGTLSLDVSQKPEAGGGVTSTETTAQTPTTNSEQTSSQSVQEMRQPAGQSSSASGGFWSSLWDGIKSVAGKIWALPNTLIGLAVSTVALSFDIIQSTVLTIARRENHFKNIGISFGNNGLQIKTGLELPDSWNASGGLTIGNVILYNNADPSQNIRSPYAGHRQVNLGRHEGWHTRQGERLGIFYLPMMIANGVANENNRYEVDADDHSLVK